MLDGLTSYTHLRIRAVEIAMTMHAEVGYTTEELLEQAEMLYQYMLDGKLPIEEE